MTKVKEIWKDIPEFKGHYQASTLGRFRSVKRIINQKTSKGNGFHDRVMKGKIITPFFWKDGYVTVMLGRKKTCSAHRIIAQTFIANPKNKPQVNHINGKKHDNRVNNLEWVTQSENEIHSISIGLRNPFRGKHNPKVILNEKKIRLIREDCKLRRYGDLTRNARKFNVSPTTILDILTGKSWSYVI